MKVKELIEVLTPEQRLGICFLNEKDHFISYNDALNKEVAKISTQLVIYQEVINKAKIRVAINIYVKDENNL